MFKEDENLYKRHIESKGQVDYSTSKLASSKTIRPSKRKKAMKATVPRSTLSNSVPSDCFKTSTDSSDNSKDSPLEDKNAASTSTRKHNPTGVARRLVTSSKLSFHETPKVCRRFLVNALKSQPHVSQQSLRLSTRELIRWRSTWWAFFIWRSEVYTLTANTLRFFEYQIVVLKKEVKKIKLTALKLKDGKAEIIAEGP